MTSESVTMDCLNFLLCKVSLAQLLDSSGIQISPTSKRKKIFNRSQFFMNPVTGAVGSPSQSGVGVSMGKVKLGMREEATSKARVTMLIKK